MGVRMSGEGILDRMGSALPRIGSVAGAVAVLFLTGVSSANGADLFVFQGFNASQAGVFSAGFPSGGAHHVNSDWASNLALSPDGQSVAYDDFDSILIAPIGGGSGDEIYDAPSGGYSEKPAFHPDGARVAFQQVGEYPDDYDIYIVGMGGASSSSLITWDGDQGSPSWSSDGEHLAFTSTATPGGASLDGQAIYIADANGANPVRLTDPTEMYASDPEISPDGSTVVFEANDFEGPNQIWRVDVDGTNLTQLTNDENYNNDPDWTPNGDRISFTTSREADNWDYRTYTITPSGTGEQPLRPSGFDYVQVAAFRQPSIWFSNEDYVALYGDDVPPSVVSNFDAVLDGATDEAAIRWDPARDPRLVDGSKGSGVVAYDVRYRRDGGSWSGWETVDQAQIILDEAEESEEIDLEVKAIDAQDNVGSNEDGSVVIPAPSSGDFFGPLVAASGVLAGMDAGYVGSSELDLGVEADDEEDGEGVARVAVLSEAGQEIGAEQMGCGSGCPETADATVSVDTGELPEGETTLLVRADDGVNNRVIDNGVDLIVDHTEPAAASQLLVSEFDVGTGVATVNWTDGVDPEVSPGMAGAGATSAVVRYYRDGVWSAWQESEDGSISVGSLSPDEEFTVEVRSRDAVGNLASTTSTELEARASDGAHLADSATALANRDQVIGQASAEFTNCQPLLHRLFERHTAPSYQVFMPRETELRSFLQIYCHNVDPRFERIRIEAGLALKTGTGSSPSAFVPVVDPGDLGAGFIEFEAPDEFGHILYDNGPKYLCEPRAGGKQEYVAFGTIEYMDDQGADVTVEWDSGRGGGFLGWDIGPQPKKATCPTAKVRRQRELAGWRAQRLYTPTPVKKSSATAALRSELGSPPWKPPGTKRAWDAHHLVPLGQPGADDMRQLMFRCGVHANASDNGVYLRGYGLRKDRSAYDELLEEAEGAAQRAYHGDTYGLKYVRLLRKKYLAPILRKHREVCTPWDGLYDALAAARSDLRDSEFGVEKPNH